MFHAAAPAALKTPPNFFPPRPILNQWQWCSWPCLHAPKPLWAQLHPELYEGSNAREMPVPQTLVRMVGHVPVVIQAESQRQPLLVVQDARRALCTCSLQNWNTEADIFMTFIIFPVSSIATQQRPALCLWQVCGETGAACWGSSQHAKALLAILWGLSLNFDASLHNERSPTYQGHENLTDFFSCRRFRSLFSLVARNRFVGGDTNAHVPFPPPPPFSLRGQLYRQYSAAALRSCFLHRIPCNTYSPHCRYKKNTLEVWATGIKGQTSKSMAKQVHLWIYGHSLLLATSVLLVGSAALNKALVTLAFPQHQ